MNRPVIVIVLLLIGLCGTVTLCSAQTPSSVCALDSLRLISPDTIDVEFSTEGRRGVKIIWPDVPNDVSTCIAVVDTENIHVPIVIDGIYADEVDRELKMLCEFGGLVGADDIKRVTVAWSNINISLTGVIKGEINLSNSGGILSFGDGTWGKANNGLYPYLPNTDVLHLCEDPSGSGTMLAHLRGLLSRGLWKLSGPGGTWTRIGEDRFVDGTIGNHAITAIAFSPHDDLIFAVGTVKQGLFITRNGGASFDQYQTEFTDSGSWNLRAVSALSWVAEDRLFVAIDQLGFYRSTDEGSTYDLQETFLVSENFPTGGDNVAPAVNCILDRGAEGMLVGVDRFGLYETLTDGATWSWGWSSLLSPDEEEKDVISIIVSPVNDDHFTVGTRNSGLWWTPNRGDSWTRLSGDPDFFSSEDTPKIPDLVIDEAAGLYLGLADGFGLLECAIGDTAWSLTSLPAPGITNFNDILVTAQTGSDYLISTYGGGIYASGTQIRLSDTIIKTQTDDDLEDIDFGIFISFGSDDPLEIAEFDVNSSFKLVLQDFQGYAVWRGPVNNPDQMELIGLYDKSNPESCIDGYCGDESYNILPNCFADKRAACFDFTDLDNIEFFDGNVYEGFTYYYAVTTFDYGNIATASPSSMSNDQLFSSRYLDDDLTVFPGAGNRVQLYVHMDAEADVDEDEDEIFAYPNPLRLDSGFTGAEGDDVRFKNLPAKSRILVFTLDGDLVADLGAADQVGDIITWTTRNAGERLASGVYIYKVEMEQREDFYGKVVVIR